MEEKDVDEVYALRCRAAFEALCEPKPRPKEFNALQIASLEVVRLALEEFDPNYSGATKQVYSSFRLKIVAQQCYEDAIQEIWQEGSRALSSALLGRKVVSGKIEMPANHDSWRVATDPETGVSAGISSEFDVTTNDLAHVLIVLVADGADPK